MNKAVLVVLALLGIALAGCWFKTYSDLKKEKARVVRLIDEVLQLEHDLADCGERQDELASANEELQYELEDCQSSNEDNENDVYYRESENSDLEDDNSDLERRVRELEDELEECEDRLRDRN